MYINKVRSVRVLFFILACSSFVSCFKDLTVVNDVYKNDFNAGNLTNLELSGWSNAGFGPLSDKRISSFTGETLLGKFNNNLVRLTLSNLPVHQVMRVELDLYIHNSWKNDIWRISFDNNNMLLTGFSNDTAIRQSYPNWYGNAALLSPAGANAQNTDLPGTCSLVTRSRASSMYHIVISATHSNSSFILECNDAGGVANDTCTRSWSMDNLKITTLKN